ncbi:MAG TPA: Gfo/Idh/MocA family oxidoreductase, partial [Tepidisphaeraceae bacterium]
RAVEMQKKFDVGHAFHDLEKFFASGIDAVIITSPASVHFEHVIAAAAHGKPALCEKPLAMNEDQAQQMITVMQQANLPLFVGFTYRFAPVALEIKRMIDAGEIGTLRSLRLPYVWDCHGKFNERANPASGLYQRRVGRMDEGGPMVDCGVHQIDLARWWTGSEITRVTGAGAWVEQEGYDAPDHIYLHADHANGAHTMVEISFTYGHTTLEPRNVFAYELIGTNGLIRYSRENHSFELLNDQGTRKLQWTDEKNFEGMYANFESALRTGENGNMPTAADGLIATKIARRATEAAIAWRKS